MDKRTPLNWADVFEKPMEHLLDRPCTWAKAWRRLYVCTWPLSSWVRWSMFGILSVLWLAVGFTGYMAYHAQCVWRGKETIWGD